MRAMQSGLRDNHKRGSVAQFLEQAVKDGASLSFVTAFFTVYAHARMEPVLQRAKFTRLLFGEPAFIAELDTNLDKAAFSIFDDSLKLTALLQQRLAVKKCRDWFAQHVEVRSVREPGFLHGKLYHAKTEHASAAIVGSSNFTVRGLGLANVDSNVELNLIASDDRDRDELLHWFDELWNDADRVVDVKDSVLAHLDRAYQDQSPQFIYYKTLYHLFDKALRDDATTDKALLGSALFDSLVWKKLFEFQKQGAKSAITKLRKHNGCILADSVGLGKTFTALAVIKYFECRNERVLVLCPKKLEHNWRLYRENYAENPFEKDRFRYDVLFHTDLTREGGMSGGLDLSQINWGHYDLIVIDESHNFRNNAANDPAATERQTRYQRLMADIIRAGVPTKVLLLSATPVNNSLTDLRNQISIIAGGDVYNDSEADSAFADSLNVNSVRRTCDQAQRRFLDWTRKPANERNKRDLFNVLGGDFLSLLDGLTIARSRRHIAQHFAKEVDTLGGFPKRLPPQCEYVNEIDSNCELPSYDDLSLAFSPVSDKKRPGEISLAMFRPSAYLRTDLSPEVKAEYSKTRNKHLNQESREKTLTAIMRVLLLKRLESSISSFTLTLERTVGRINTLLKRIEHHERLAIDHPELDLGEVDIEAVAVEDEALAEEIAEALDVGSKLKYRLAHIRLGDWKLALQQDEKVLGRILTQAKKVSPARDNKLIKLRALIAEKAANPSISKHGEPNRKLLIFTAYADTAQYLYDNLAIDNLRRHGLHSGLVLGGGASQTARPARNTFQAVLTDFAPRVRGRSDPDAPEIDVLIATDCISEGQNLHDCDTVINYDIHWNPVRIIQRFGRVDRIGSRAQSVAMVNFWPTEHLDQYIKLKSRVETRMALVDLAATQTDNPLDENQLQDIIDQDLRLRDQQIKRLQNEVFDLEEANESLTLADFSLDEFRTDLKQFLDRHRKELAGAPLGLFAVVAPDPAIPMSQPGALFCLRRKEAGIKPNTDAQKLNPIEPYYLVYVLSDGNVRLTGLQAKSALNLFRMLAEGKPQAHFDLCRAFDAQTNHGQDMSTVEALLKTAIQSIRQSLQGAVGAALGNGRGAVIPKGVGLGDSGTGDQDAFELITWLVIK